MKLLFPLLILTQAAFAQDDYRWEKDIGHNRREVGIVSTRVLQDLNHDSLRIALSCAEDELMVMGGCSAIYGLDLTMSSPMTSRRPGSLTEWACMGDTNKKTALTIAGNKPTADTPDGELTGALMLTIVCQRETKTP